MSKRSENNHARAEQVKDFIRTYWLEHHYSPSVNEIAAHFNTSTSVANYWVGRLEVAGWIEHREFGVARNIVPVEIFEHRPVFPIVMPVLEAPEHGQGAQS